jgi:hypothetical protein
MHLLWAKFHVMKMQMLGAHQEHYVGVTEGTVLHIHVVPKLSHQPAIAL